MNLFESKLLRPNLLHTK